MQRRTFLSTVAGTALGSKLVGADAVGRVEAATTVPPLVFDSTASLLDSSGGTLTDDSLVAVWAESSATNTDEDGNGDAVSYPSSTDVPLVAVDGPVVGIGCPFVDGETNWQNGNEEFLLNVWDDLVGSGDVYWDSGHGQFYDLSQFAKFEDYAESNGYTVHGTSDLVGNLSNADAVVVTSPTTAFTASELDALANFASNGGVVFLHDQADYSDYDETANANTVAQALGAGFRFNDDQVVDATNNGGAQYRPETTNFNEAFDFFADRSGLELDKSKVYASPVTEVLDGDTVKVELDGTVESIRVLGIDTPEKSANQQYERTQEWEGIEDLTTLANYGTEATDYARARLSGVTVDVAFDPEEPTRDAFGRVLAYLYYDADGSGSRDTLYNEEIVTDGLTRVYDSGLSRHDALRAEEQAARDAGLGLWAASDPTASSEIRNRSVDDLFFPAPATVRTDSGAVDASRVPVSAESTASQTVYSGGQSYSGDLPLAAVDTASNVAMVGSPFVDESYESAEGYAVDTSTYENFVFLTNLVDSLTDRTGDVVVDGGHGQFGVDYALSVEDAAYYKRYLEGVGIGFEQVNDLPNADLSGARAYVVTTPPEAFTQTELDALAAFRDAGGAVVLLGSGNVFSGPRGNLDAVANALGSDLRLNADSVTDTSNNVDGDSSVPVTTNVDTSFSLFSAYSDTNGGGDTGGSADGVSITTVNADAAGDDGNNLNDEYVVLDNAGSASADLTGWTLSDAADHVYTVPSFTLDAGATVTVHTGSGTDTATDLYWGNGQPLWNNGGDTATLADASGAVVDEYTYPDDEGGDGGSGSGQFAIARINEDAQGNDRNNMNDEYVVFENTGTAALDLTNWQVSDEVEKTYTFPSFSLAEGAQVTLHTGSGTDTTTDLYWSASGPVWNNGGDTVTVTDDSGTTVLSQSY